MAKDVAEALGYAKGSNPTRLFQTVPEEWKGVKRIHTPRWLAGHAHPHRAGPLLLPWSFGQARGVAVSEMAGGGGVAVHPQDGRLSGKDGAGVLRCRKEPLFLHQRHPVIIRRHTAV